MREREILVIIQRKKDHSFWHQINYAMGKKRGGLVRCVLMDNPNNKGQQIEHTTQASVQEALFNNIHHRPFFLAKAVPICQGRLRGWFGYNAVSRMAHAVLDGTYVYADNFDEATKKICWECVAIQALIPPELLNILLTKEDWSHKWWGRCKTTSLLKSGLHFGHYLVGIELDHISHFHALKASLIIKREIVLDRWAHRLSVMLEKICGCTLITKLRSISLMEADFNATNKVIYGHHLMDTIRKYKLMPEVIFSEKNCLADDSTLGKELFYDIVHQTCLLAGIAAVNINNCYD
jgi:hypothetical protein